MLESPLLMVLHDPPDLLIIGLHEPVDPSAGHINALHGRLCQCPLWQEAKDSARKLHAGSPASPCPGTWLPQLPALTGQGASSVCLVYTLLGDLISLGRGGLGLAV